MLSFLLNAAILETLTISNGRLFQISIILFAKLYRDTFSLHGCLKSPRKETSSLKIVELVPEILESP